MTAPPRARLGVSGAADEVIEGSGDPCLVALAQVFRRLGGLVASTETSSGIVGCPRCRRRNRVPAVGTGVPVCGNCRHTLPWIAAARDDDFAAVAEQATVPVLVMLWAPWCGLSWLARPVVEGLALHRPGILKLVEVDLVAAPEVTWRHTVRAAPTLLVLRAGEVVARRYGVAPAADLRGWLDAALVGARSRGAQSRSRLVARS